MAHRILRLSQVCERTGLSKSWLYKAIAEGNFVAQIHISRNLVGWEEAAVDRWIEQRIAASRSNAAK